MYTVDMKPNGKGHSFALQLFGQIEVAHLPLMKMVRDLGHHQLRTTGV